MRKNFRYEYKIANETTFILYTKCQMVLRTPSTFQIPFKNIKYSFVQEERRGEEQTIYDRKYDPKIYLCIMKGFNLKLTRKKKHWRRPPSLYELVKWCGNCRAVLGTIIKYCSFEHPVRLFYTLEQFKRLTEILFSFSYFPFYFFLRSI